MVEIIPGRQPDHGPCKLTNKRLKPCSTEQDSTQVEDVRPPSYLNVDPILVRSLLI